MATQTCSLSRDIYISAPLFILPFIHFYNFSQFIKNNSKHSTRGSPRTTSDTCTIVWKKTVNSTKTIRGLNRLFISVNVFRLTSDPGSWSISCCHGNYRNAGEYKQMCLMLETHQILTECVCVWPIYGNDECEIIVRCCSTLSSAGLFHNHVQLFHKDISGLCLKVGLISVL